MQNIYLFTYLLIYLFIYFKYKKDVEAGSLELI